jgi:hypothetical protein
VDSWLEYLDIVQHPFLGRFANDYAIEVMYEDSVRGYPSFVMHRPEHWYGMAVNTQTAIDRLVETVTARLQTASPKLIDDLLLLLEDCEDAQSIDLIEKIKRYFPESRDTPAPAESLATEPQRKYLRQLGVPKFSGTKHEARLLIDKLKKEKRNV